MAKPIPFGLVAGLLLVGVAGYGFGTGWIRLGPPIAPAASPTLPEPLDPAVARVGLSQVPPPLPPDAGLPAPIATPVVAGATAPAAPLSGDTKLSYVDASGATVAVKDAETVGLHGVPIHFKVESATPIPATSSLNAELNKVAANGAVTKLSPTVASDKTVFPFDLAEVGDYQLNLTTVAADKTSSPPLTIKFSVKPGPPLPLNAGNTSVTYTDASGKVAPLTDGLTFSSDGPSVTLTATTKVKGPTFDESAATLAVTLQKFNVTGYTDPTVGAPGQNDAKDSITRPITINEAGAYRLSLVKSLAGQATDESTITFTIEPVKRVTPVVASVEEKVGDKVYAYNDFTRPIELKPGGSGSITVYAVAPEKGRALFLLDRAKSVKVKNASGTVDVAVIDDPTVQKPLMMVFVEADLTDHPADLVVVDQWTQEPSSPLTLVVIKQGLAPPVAGVKPTGPNVEFPEFTAPRPESNGFNPSDKVVTRVIRLYYYRDAHRVAQIINRDVQSWNRVAVDTRRRLAENGRNAANAATDDRRLQELKAIRAAQGSRVAEVKLKQARDAYDAAVQREADAKTQLPQYQAAGTNLSASLAAQATIVKDKQSAADALKAQVASTPNPPDALVQSLLKAQTEVTQATVDQRKLTIDKARIDQETKDLQATQDKNESQALKTALAAAQTNLETSRGEEAKQSDEDVRDAQKEDRLRENQFRLEVAAAHEDPDTYAPGKIASVDPIRQVSVSVIGEGLIQLRGPIKGVNLIRIAVNEIDSPAGQVRIGIHTVQINGEHGDRMEKVANRIQDYIDHSRFLTSQSAQLLRNAVVKYASEKAEEVADNPDPLIRERKYQDAFFGEDFMAELRAMESEFLKNSNKLLSLHSMDTTSLASSLFLLALARNDVRELILAEFVRSCREDLPQDEQNYYEAGAANRAKSFCEKDPFVFLSQNARFQSFLGFFRGPSFQGRTLNPLQREFVRLAQIFKSRLVTELELAQRLKERGLIEERLGNYLAELQEQRSRENRASTALQVADQTLIDARQKLLVSLTGVIAQIDNLLQISQLNDSALSRVQSFSKNVDKMDDNAMITLDRLPGQDARLSPKLRVGTDSDLKKYVFAAGTGVEKQRNSDALRAYANLYLGRVRRAVEMLDHFKIQQPDKARELLQAKAEIDDIQQRIQKQRPGELDGDTFDSIAECLSLLNGVLKYIGDQGIKIKKAANALVIGLGNGSFDSAASYREWVTLRDLIQKTIQDPDQLKQVNALLTATDSLFTALYTTDLKYQAARKLAQDARRPLDTKKLLDMLIDDIEEKFIELLEGTRSHTANVDAYIKTIATALDDDFNTQFYYPAFAGVRKASRYWDVNLAQIETTNVLTNNRSFAKVEPQATMEFDLPKRDILINEAMNGALAMTKDFGALVNDPTFLSLTKLRSGQPTSSLSPGAGLGANTVRNVLPGLPTSNDEKLLSQQGAGDSKFGSAMEALIPDPAVYKFETGTGFEIRPVIEPDGQSVVFHFNYMYTTNVREPVRADEKHLGRVKRHFIDTDVQLGNYELREVSRYQVALKASRTSRGVPLLEDIPGLGVIFRPLPSAESSLQENIVMAQGTIFPTLFDLMGLRWAPAVADLDTLRLRNAEFLVRGRARDLSNHVFDVSSSNVDEFLRIPPAERRPDLYRTQETIPDEHPDHYRGPGLNLRDSGLREGYDPRTQAAPSGFIPSDSSGEPLPPLPGIPGERAIPMPSAAPIIVPEGGAFSSRRATPRTAPAPVARDSRLPRLEGPTASSARFRDPALSRTSAGKAKAAVVKPRTPANEPAAPTAKGRAGFLSRLRGGS